MAREGRSAEEVIAALARRSHGVVTTGRLRAVGITDDELRHRVAKGALIRVHRGVFRVGHDAPSREATYLAAVLACGKRALLSGAPGAHLLGVVLGPPPPPQVTAPTWRRVAGVRTVRATTMPRGISWLGVPVVTPAEALVDLAGVLLLDELARAAHEAGVRHRTTPRQVVGALSRRPNAKGTGNLELVIGRRVRVTLSQLERRFLRTLRLAGLPLPDQVNHRVGAHRVDCRWSALRVTVELDSYTFHNSRYSWQQDHRRTRAAYARGDEPRRYTYEDVFETPTAMLAELTDLLLRPSIAA